VASSALEAVRVLRREPELVEKLRHNSELFRHRLRELGYSPLDGDGAIIPIIVGETAFAIQMSERMLDESVFVTGFGFPVVPEGTARIRVQMSAALEEEHLEQALEAFERVGSELGLI
jgi:glycine C-acetyltransferase